MKVVVILCVLVGTLASSPEGRFFFRGLDVFVGSFYSQICHLLPTGILWIALLLFFFLTLDLPRPHFSDCYSAVYVPFSMRYFPVEWRQNWCTVFEWQKDKHSGLVRKDEVVTRKSISCDAGINMQLSAIFIPRKPGCEPVRGGVGWGRCCCGRGDPRLCWPQAVARGTFRWGHGRLFWWFRR